MDDPTRRTDASGARAPEEGRGHRGWVLSDAIRLSLWFTAWCEGRASLDDARDEVVAGDAAHDVVGLPAGPEGEPVPLIVALGLLRAERAGAARLALPDPGDPLGLAGPPAFNAEALEAGEAVLLTGAGLGLVPVRAGAGVVWRCLPAEEHRQVPDLFEADSALRRALPGTADALADLEVARWRPEVADELMALRQDQPMPVPSGTAPRVQRMIALATRCRVVVSLALKDDGGAVTAREADARREALRPLDRAARRALVAACEHPTER